VLLIYKFESPVVYIASNIRFLILKLPLFFFGQFC